MTWGHPKVLGTLCKKLVVFFFLFIYVYLFIIIFLSWVFPTSFNWWLFHKCRNDSKFLLVSRTLLSILADFNSAVVWMISILPLNPNSSNLFPRSLRTITSVPTTFDITVTFMFHSFFSSQARTKYSSIVLLSFIFSLWSPETGKSITWQGLFIYTRIIKYVARLFSYGHFYW